MHKTLKKPIVGIMMWLYGHGCCNKAGGLFRSLKAGCLSWCHHDASLVLPPRVCQWAMAACCWNHCFATYWSVHRSNQ